MKKILRNLCEEYAIGKRQRGAVEIYFLSGFAELKMRSQRMLCSNGLSGSNDIITNIAVPMMWSSGTKPQYRESLELSRLSPIIH